MTEIVIYLDGVHYDNGSITKRRGMIWKEKI